MFVSHKSTLKLCGPSVGYASGSSVLKGFDFHRLLVPTCCRYFSSEGVCHGARGVVGIKADEDTVVLIGQRELAVPTCPKDFGPPVFSLEVLVDERADRVEQKLSKR